MPINASPHYQKAEREYLEAETTEQKINSLKKMIALAPGHKGAEKLRAELKKRLSKLKYTKEQETKKKKSGKKESLRKTGDAQVTIVGIAATGKSSLLSLLTHAKPKIAPHGFTTTKPEIGTLNFEGFEIQIIEIPAITGNLNNDRANLSTVRDSDLIIVVATTKNELEKTLKELKDTKINKKKIIVMNKSDLKNPLAINIPYLIVSCKTKQNIDELKKRVIRELSLIRVYTKDPKKKPAEKPVVFHEEATIKEVCEKVNRIFVERFSFAKVWGISAKFPGQQVGLEHKVKDKDIVEIHLN